jgi:AraC-like DNA-binding protein
MKKRPFIGIPFFPALVFLITGISLGDDLQHCVQFSAPEQKAVIIAPICTLGVASSCRPIQQVDIMARYLPAQGDSSIVDTIARLRGPSFRYIWNLSSIPNQLSQGIGIIIEVTFADGEMFGTRREGIFLAHQKIDYPTLKPLVYDFPESRSFNHDTVVLASGDPSRLEYVQMYWNEQSIAVRVTVRDPSFSADRSESLLDRMGIEICADPEKKRSLYPSEEDLIITVPLSGEPYRKTFQPTFNADGTFNLNIIKTRLNLSSTVEKQSGRGFTETVTIPAYLFGKTIPTTMGFNVIVSTADARGNLVSSSFIEAAGLNKFSPELWPTLVVLPKPISKIPWIIWIACFVVGITIPLVLYLFFSSFGRASPASAIRRRSDAEKLEFSRIRETIDQFILQPEGTLAAIAGELQTPLPKLRKLVKRATGMSFQNYLQYLRTEIVCERLRSSNATEMVVAATSGFRTIREMQRFFRRFYRMSPEEFRSTQKIEHVDMGSES